MFLKAWIVFLKTFLFDKLLTYHCNSSFLAWSYYNYSHSGAFIHRCFENIQKALKSVVLAFFCDSSAENLSRTEVAKYIAPCDHIESFTENTFLWRITKLTCVGDFLVKKCFEFWHQFMCYSNNLTGESFFAWWCGKTRVTSYELKA